MYRSYILLVTLFLSLNVAAQKQRAKHVVMIGLDGFGAYAVPKAEMPVFKDLMKNGSWTLKGRNVMPTSSAVNWATLLMGAGPTMHGYTEWNSAIPEIPSMVTNAAGMYPSVFSILKEQKPQAKTALVYSWGGINPLVQEGTTDIRVDGKGNDDFCVDTLVSIIKSEKPVFSFIHLDEPDGVGHNIGHNTPEYYEKLKTVDTWISKIVDAVKDAGIMKNTVIIVTSDHGGIGKGHGGKNIAEIEIPWLAYGKKIKKGHEIQNTVMNFDNAATIAWLLGLKTPESWRGVPIKEIRGK